MTEQDKRHLAAVRRMYAGEETELATVAPEIVWHVPGHNPVSGDYVGYDAYSNTMPARMAPLTRWDFTLGDVMVNGDYVVATFTLAGERKGVSVALRGAHIMRLNAMSQVVEGWGFAEDQDALDAFFGA